MHYIQLLSILDINVVWSTIGKILDDRKEWQINGNIILKVSIKFETGSPISVMNIKCLYIVTYRISSSSLFNDSLAPYGI